MTEWPFGTFSGHFGVDPFRELPFPDFGGLAILHTIVDDRMAIWDLFWPFWGGPFPGAPFSRFWWLGHSTYNRR